MKKYKITYADDMKSEDITWHDVAHHLSIAMVNMKHLKEYGNPVYTGHMDLALVYPVVRATTSESIVYMLKQKDLDNLGVTKQDVHDMAVKNALNERRFRITPLSETFDTELLAPIAKGAPGTPFKTGVEPSRATIVDVDPVTGEENILACHRKNRPFGAAYMFLPSVLEEVSKRFNKQDFYIVPISAHSVWFIKNSYVSNNGKKSYRDVEIDLLDMLEEFNDEQNESWRDVLTYQVYYYMGGENQILMPIANS